MFTRAERHTVTAHGHKNTAAYSTFPTVYGMGELGQESL